MSERRSNAAHSVRQRLLNVSRERGEEFQFILNRFLLERLVARIARSRHADRFVLKGAMLFSLWTERPHRATKDLDLLGMGENSVEGMIEAFREICRDDDATDGVVFDTENFEGTRIKEDQDYEAVRLRLPATLGTARLRAQIDIGFGDAIHPAPELVEYPSLIDLEPARIRAYPREAVIAEKFQAMVALGIANSRMKDFFDIWTLIETFPFDAVVLSEALRATFERRGTMLPTTAPLALSDEFAEDQTKQAQWVAFLRKGRLSEPTVGLDLVVSAIRRFLMPLLESSIPSPAIWPAGGPWTTPPED